MATLDGFTITGGNANGREFMDDNGGGLYIDECSPVIVACTFLNNKASGDGGAIDIWEGSVVLEQCTFVGNTAGVNGGALGLSRSSATIRRCTFIDNDARGRGGAIAALTDTLWVENSLFVGNSAGEDRGIIDCNDFTLLNSTVIGPGIPGSLIFSYSPEKAFITNSLIVGGDQGRAIAGATILNSIFTNYPTQASDVDLGFVDPENGDFRLRPGSPAIDAGTEDGAPETDLDGYSRPQGNDVDMGAYEFVMP